MSEPIGTAALADLLGRDDAVVVDARPIAAFNGWPLRGESRGGHLPGAVPFPSAWVNAASGGDLERLLEDKGVVRGKTVVVCGYDPDAGRAMADLLEALGYERVRFYADGLLVWMSQPGRPVHRLPGYRQLVHPPWLDRLLEERRRNGDESSTDVLVHVNFDNREEYEREHVPGAIHLDTQCLEEPERWNRRSPEELERTLLEHGITRHTRVVVYGRTGMPDMSQAHPGKEAGQIGAMRAAVLLMYAGVEDVRVLDGGLNAWRASGYPVTSTISTPRPARSFEGPVPGRPELVVDIEQAKRMLADPGSELVSVRSWAEFIGEVSGYHYVKPKGRIPGAVFGNCGSDAYHMQNYRNPDNTVRNYEEIEARWRDAGLAPDKHIGFYCGTGWRASEACFCARLMGWDRSSIYDGGWFEWSIDEENPLETGVPR
jgi:thiosulfate/3-mercaptopyruvate sulfurtransferase